MQKNKIILINFFFPQMCHDRGYLVTQDELDQTLDQFKAAFGHRPSEKHPGRGDLTILVAHNDDPTGKILLKKIKEINKPINYLYSN